jgi:hypothetical protein
MHTQWSRSDTANDTVMDAFITMNTLLEVFVVDAALCYIMNEAE